MSEETFRWVVAGGVGLAALSFVVLAIVAAVIASLAMKLKAKLDPILDLTKPIVNNVRETAEAVKPKIVKISEHAVEVSKLVVDEAHRYSDLSKDVAARAKAQVARIDVAVDHTVEQAQEATVAVKGAVLRPIREVDGVLAGLRTGITTFARGGRKATVNSATQDEEMFI